MTADGGVKAALIGAATTVGNTLATVLEVGKKNREDEATFPELEENSAKGKKKKRKKKEKKGDGKKIIKFLLTPKQSNFVFFFLYFVSVSNTLIAFVNILKRLPGAEHIKIDELIGDFDGFAEEELKKCTDVINGAFRVLRYIISRKINKFLFS